MLITFILRQKNTYLTLLRIQLAPSCPNSHDSDTQVDSLFHVTH